MESRHGEKAQSMMAKWSSGFAARTATKLPLLNRAFLGVMESWHGFIPPVPLFCSAQYLAKAKMELPKLPAIVACANGKHAFACSRVEAGSNGRGH